MKYGTLLLVVMGIAVQSLGQVSPDEAAARLKAREGARSASQPSEDYQRAIRVLQQQVADLKIAIAKLQKEADDLKKENGSLRDELAPFKQAAVGAGAGKPRPPEIVRAIAQKQVIVGMTIDDVTQVIKKTGEGYEDRRKEQELVGGKTVNYETWYLNRERGGKVHFTDGVVDRVTDR